MSLSKRSFKINMPTVDPTERRLESQRVSGINPICDMLAQEVTSGYQSSREHIYQFEKTKKVKL
jgi:hypothetical protein